MKTILILGRGRTQLVPPKVQVQHVGRDGRADAGVRIATVMTRKKLFFWKFVASCVIVRHSEQGTVYIKSSHLPHQQMDENIHFQGNVAFEHRDVIHGQILGRWGPTSLGSVTVEVAVKES